MNLVEIDGRITTLIAQRNTALDQLVVLGGQFAKLQQEYSILKKEVEEQKQAAKEASDAHID